MFLDGSLVSWADDGGLNLLSTLLNPRKEPIFSIYQDFIIINLKKSKNMFKNFLFLLSTFKNKNFVT